MTFADASEGGTPSIVIMVTHWAGETVGGSRLVVWCHKTKSCLGQSGIVVVQPKLMFQDEAALRVVFVEHVKFLIGVVPQPPRSVEARLPIHYGCFAKPAMVTVSVSDGCCCGRGRFFRRPGSCGRRLGPEADTVLSVGADSCVKKIRVIHNPFCSSGIPVVHNTASWETPSAVLRESRMTANVVAQRLRPV